ncbi:unnamed protein product [Effrenium voratum]|nr:unnamed protein product [Effrenium voratum]
MRLVQLTAVALPLVEGRSFAHVVNLLPREDVGQRVAMASWVHAQQLAQAEGFEVSLHTVEIATEPKVWRHPAFAALPDVERTSRSMLGVRLPESPNLPLLRDVLEKAAALEAEYTVFTLADIAFMPDFYRQVDVLLRSSAALSIHRVGVQNWEPLVEAEAVPLDRLFNLTRRHPQLHPGSDCFVFETKRIPAMLPALGYVFIGSPPFGQLLLEAMKTTSRSEPQIVWNRHLTFHLDLQRRKFDWKDNSHESQEFVLYNNIAGFGLSENGIVFSTRKATRELMEEVATSFTYPSSVLLDKLGHFVDLEQCFQESGTIVAVVMVLLGTRSGGESSTVMGFDLWRPDSDAPTEFGSTTGRGFCWARQLQAAGCGTTPRSEALNPRAHKPSPQPSTSASPSARLWSTIPC